MRLTKQYLDLYRRGEEILLRAGVSGFPIDPTWLAHQNGVLVVGYERFSAVSGVPLAELCEISEDGFCTYRNGEYIIVYNRAILSVGRKRWTILHELSHILLGHISPGNETVYGRTKAVRRWMEKEADILTKCLIAPLPIALACGVKDENELRRLFGLSQEASEYLYQDYCHLCTDRRILALEGEALVAQNSRFLIEWQLRRFYFSEEQNRRGKHGKYCDVSVIPEDDELE